MNVKEYEEYKRKCKEFDEELEGCINGVTIACVVIMFLAIVTIIVSKL